MHGDCLLKDATSRAWERLNAKQPGPSIDTIEVNDNEQPDETIELDPKASGTIATTSFNSIRKSNFTRGKSRKRIKGKNGESAESEWMGQLEARLENTSAEAENEDNSEITGNVIFDDKRTKAERTWTEPLACLFCGHRLS